MLISATRLNDFNLNMYFSNFSANGFSEMGSFLKHSRKYDHGFTAIIVL